MSLSLSIQRNAQLCVATGQGAVTRKDIETYLARSVQEGAKGFAKLVDLTRCILALDGDDIEILADGLMLYGQGDQPGPVALVVDTALNLDMAVLLKQRVGARPFRIFTTAAAARFWLTSYREAAQPELFAPEMSAIPRPFRAL